MDLTKLRYFVAVAEEQHFGRAATRLHMTQPPLSQQIKLLEHELQAQLFVRTTRRVELTPAGELLLARGRLLLREATTLVSDVGLMGQGVSGVLRVGFCGSVAYQRMPAIIARARRELPSVQLSLQGEMLTPEMVLALEEERLDVAVLRPPTESVQLRLTLLAHDRLVIALPEDSPLASTGVVSLASIRGEPVVSYPVTSATALTIAEACAKLGFQPSIVQEATETSTVLALVAGGTGIALIPVPRGALSMPGLVFRELDDPPHVDLALAWKRERASPLMKRFAALFT
ncbi:LysR substrate-binding domain-containing protein, partial [Leucobacter sp. M11]|uniref:LysR substrate-binding domain-containing protein n=1 Tax=Leucobacter sp. M11 TaxID=2993565 RepID=UPI002D7EBC05